MKTLPLLLSLCYCMAFSQDDRSAEVVNAMRLQNKEYVPLHRDYILDAEARRLAQYYSPNMTSKQIQDYLNYGTPKQKYIAFVVSLSENYDPWGIPEFLAKEDKEFYSLVQYKYNVGVWAGDKVCIILFYKNKNVLTAISN